MFGYRTIGERYILAKISIEYCHFQTLLIFVVLLCVIRRLPKEFRRLRLVGAAFNFRFYEMAKCAPICDYHPVPVAAKLRAFNDAVDCIILTDGYGVRTDRKSAAHIHDKLIGYLR